MVVHKILALAANVRTSYLKHSISKLLQPRSLRVASSGRLFLPCGLVCEGFGHLQSVVMHDNLFGNLSVNLWLGFICNKILCRFFIFCNQIVQDWPAMQYFTREAVHVSIDILVFKLKFQLASERA